MAEFYKTSEVAEKLNVKERTVRRYIKEGKLKSVKDGNRHYIPCAAYDYFVMMRAAKAMGVKPEVMDEYLRAEVEKTDKIKKMSEDLLKGIF